MSGLRRLTAAISLKWDKILVIVIPESDADKEEMLGTNFIENVKRKTLTNLDIMFACKKLKDEGKTNEQIGQLIGKSENQVRRYIKVAEATSDLQQKLINGEATIKDVGGEKIALGGDSGENNQKYTVKSTKNGIDAKIKIEAIPENAGTVDAYIIEVKKMWKDALKSAEKNA